MVTHFKRPAAAFRTQPSNVIENVPKVTPFRRLAAAFRMATPPKKDRWVTWKSEDLYVRSSARRASDSSHRAGVYTGDPLHAKSSVLSTPYFSRRAGVYLFPQQNECRSAVSNQIKTGNWVRRVRTVPASWYLFDKSYLMN